MSDHTPRARKSQQRALGDQPVRIVTFYIRTLFQPGLADTQYNVLTFAKLVNTAVFSFLVHCANCTHTHIYRAIISTSF